VLSESHAAALKNTAGNPLRTTSTPDAPLRYPAPTGHTGKLFTIDDLQTIDGQRLYELMPLDFIGADLVTYYNGMSANGGNFLDQVLKAPEGDFRSTMEHPYKLANLKNLDKYALTLFGELGNRMAYAPEDKELKNAVMNQIILMMMLAKVLIETDPINDKPWGMKEVRRYVDRMARDGVIPYEGADAIYTLVQGGMRFRISMFDALHKFSDQLRKRFTYQ
jgi:hypothetical protein